MDFTDQMAAKLLAQSVQQLGLAMNETLCVEPDRALVRALAGQAQEALAEFLDAYGTERSGGPV